MKFAIVVVCCVFVAFREAACEIKLPQEIVDLLKSLSETCKAETETDESMVEGLRKGTISDNPKMKCYLKCMMRQLQTMREDGTLDLDLIEATMPEVIKSHGGMETVHKCNHIHEADLCETAYQLMLCFKKENSELAMFE